MTATGPTGHTWASVLRRMGSAQTGHGTETEPTQHTTCPGWTPRRPRNPPALKPRWTMSHPRFALAEASSIPFGISPQVSPALSDRRPVSTLGFLQRDEGRVYLSHEASRSRTRSHRGSSKAYATSRVKDPTRFFMRRLLRVTALAALLVNGSKRSLAANPGGRHAHSTAPGDRSGSVRARHGTRTRPRGREGPKVRWTSCCTL